MFLLLNGAFGIGKTTVARELRRRTPGAVVVDPEPIGLLLQRFRRDEDFQDIPAWRRLSVRWARLAGRFSPTVIVPMAFSNLRHLEEIRAGLAASGRPVRHVCLTAPLATVRARLASRGEPFGDQRWSWVHRRAAECCAAHENDAFATRMPTDGLGPAEIAERIAATMRNG